MDCVYDRTPWTDWLIVLEDPDPDEDDEGEDATVFNEPFDFLEFDCNYRTGFREKECEIFTLMLKDTEYICVQVLIYKNGNMQCTVNMPASIYVEKRQKIVRILPLASVSINRKTGSLLYEMYNFD